MCLLSVVSNNNPFFMLVIKYFQNKSKSKYQIISLFYFRKFDVFFTPISYQEKNTSSPTTSSIKLGFICRSLSQILWTAVILACPFLAKSGIIHANFKYGIIGYSKYSPFLYIFNTVQKSWYLPSVCLYSVFPKVQVIIFLWNHKMFFKVLQ